MLESSLVGEKVEAEVEVAVGEEGLEVDGVIDVVEVEIDIEDRLRSTREAKVRIIS
jgi:hypothetical protein